MQDRILVVDDEEAIREIVATKLTDNGQIQAIAISPDGRYVAYARGDEIRQSLWMREIAARTDQQILTSGSRSMARTCLAPSFRAAIDRIPDPVPTSRMEGERGED